MIKVHSISAAAPALRGRASWLPLLWIMCACTGLHDDEAVSGSVKRGDGAVGDAGSAHGRGPVTDVVSRGSSNAASDSGSGSGANAHANIDADAASMSTPVDSGLPNAGSSAAGSSAAGSSGSGAPDPGPPPVVTPMCLNVTQHCDNASQCCGALSCGDTTLGRVCCGEQGAPCATANGEDCCGALSCGNTTLGRVCCGEQGAACATTNGEDCCGQLDCIAGHCG